MNQINDIVLNKEHRLDITGLYGWKDLVVIYYLSPIHSIIQMTWHVKDTSKHFHIPLHIIYENEGSIDLHIKNFLKIFRDDYILWHNQDYAEEWMKLYRENFSSLILVDI